MAVDRATNHPEYARLLTGLTDLEKMQAAEKTAHTMNTPGWDLIVHLLETHRTRLLNGLVRSKVLTQAEYAARLAEVRGVDAMRDASQTVLHAGQEAERELVKIEGAC